MNQKVSSFLLNCIVFLLFLLPSIIFSQEKETLAIKAFNMALQNPDSAFVLANKALSIARKNGNQKEIAHALNSKGWVYFHKGSLDSSILNYHSARKIFSDLKLNEDVVKVNINLSEAYLSAGKMNSSLKCLISADSIVQKVNNIALETDIKRQFAIVYRESNSFEKSSFYFQEALEGFKKLKDFRRYFNTSTSYSILLNEQGEYNKSIAVLNDCIQISQEHHLEPYNIAMLFENLGQTYVLKKEYDVALNNFKSALKIFETLGNPADIAYESACIGGVYLEMKDYGNAENFLIKAYDIYKKKKAYSELTEIANSLSQSHKERSEWSESLKYLEESIQWKDSANLNAVLAETNALKEKYEAEKRQSEINELKVKNDLSEAVISRNRFAFLLGLISILLAIGILVFYLKRLRYKKKIERQQMQNQIAKDLHDEIGSGLSSLSINSKVALMQLDNIEGVENKLKIIQNQSFDLMNRMSEIVWLINPNISKIENVFEKLVEYGFDNCNSLGITFTPIINLNDSENEYNADIMKNIYLFGKESINNALKHSQCKNLILELNIDKKGIIKVMVKDDGEGFDEKNIKSGLGLVSLKERAKDLGLSVEISSKPNEGTTVLLKGNL